MNFCLLLLHYIKKFPEAPIIGREIQLQDVINSRRSEMNVR